MNNENQNARNGRGIPTSVIVGVIVALVSIVTGLMSPMYVMILGLSSNLDTANEKINELSSRLIAPVAALTERVDGVREAVSELDRTLQQEIEALKVTVDAKFRTQDKALQGEISAADHESSGRHDVQGEQIRALERVVFPKEAVRLERR